MDEWESSVKNWGDSDPQGSPVWPRFSAFCLIQIIKEHLGGKADWVYVPVLHYGPPVSAGKGRNEGQGLEHD